MPAPVLLPDPAFTTGTSDPSNNRTMTIAPFKAFLAVAFLLASCPVTAKEGTVPLLEPPGTVLFVGNSFTFWNQGLWTHMQALTAARGEGLGPGSG